jgi:hypothetical protein
VKPRDAYYLVDDRFGAYPTTALLARERAGVLPPGWPAPGGGSVRPEDGGPPIPVSPDGTLQPGVPYPSSSEPNVRFYLPFYRLATAADGRRGTSLRWRREGDDPEGPLGFLTIELAADGPPAGDFQLREIQHDAVARIVYQPPVRSGGPPPSPLHPFLGDWVNVDPATRGMTRLEITETGDGSASFHGYGRCHPTDCDWGLARAGLAGEALIGTYDHGWKQTRIIARRQGDQLAADVVDDYTQADGRTDRTTSYVLANRQPPTPTVVEAGPTLRIEAGSLEPAGGNLRRCRLAIHSKPEFDRLYEIMTVPGLGGRLEIHCFASVGLRTWRQLVQAIPMAGTPIADGLTLATVARRDVVPLRVLRNRFGEPALLRVPAESRQVLSNFCFPLDADAYMFDVPIDQRPTGHHILIRMEAVDDDGRPLGVFYQDSGFSDRFLYQPQEFRLSRAGDPPYLPELRILPVAMAAGDGTADGSVVRHQALINYRAVPHIDPRALEAMKRQAGPDANFLAVAPESSQLSLRLPEDEAGGGLATILRDDVAVTFEHGILDQFEVSDKECKRIVALLGSSGLEGSVEATLLGSTTTTVPVRLSLRTADDSVLASTFKGRDGADGPYRVTVRNLIESPVVLERLHRVTVARDVVADPQTTAGMELAPGANVDLEYQVDPADAAVSGFEPRISVAVRTDLDKLLPELVVLEGYTSATFPVQVTIDAGLWFGTAPPGQRPLAGVRVEFDSAVSVTLTPATPAVAVTLPIPFVPWMLNSPEGRHYRYQVINLHHDDAGTVVDGARSGLLQSGGEPVLDVEPVTS